MGLPSRYTAETVIPFTLGMYAATLRGLRKEVS